MPKQTTEERIATLEAQVQGLADHIAEDIHGWGTGYRMAWSWLDDAPERQWIQLYEWEKDPNHPLHQKAGRCDA